MRTLFILTLNLLLSAACIAQGGYGEIRGKMVDKHGEPLPFGTAAIDAAGKIIGAISDEDGDFVIKPLNPGTYTLQLSYAGFHPVTIQDVKVNADRITFAGTIEMSENTVIIGGGAYVYEYKDPLIDPEEATKVTMRAAEISKTPMAKNPIGLIASMSSEISQKPDSDELYFRGSRGGSTVFFIDGVKILRGTGRYPGGAIGAVSVYTGGLPAKYGDTTGGVVVIETRSYADLYNEHMSKLQR